MVAGQDWIFTRDTVIVLSPSNIINHLTLASPLCNCKHWQQRHGDDNIVPKAWSLRNTKPPPSTNQVNTLSDLTRCPTDTTILLEYTLLLRGHLPFTFQSTLHISYLYFILPVEGSIATQEEQWSAANGSLSRSLPPPSCKDPATQKHLDNILIMLYCCNSEIPSWLLTSAL